LATFLHHGLRCEELCGLRVRDLQSRQGVPHLRILVKNAQRSKTVKVLSRGYANEASGASIKARFQKSGSS
jgi:hypothetical protein